MEQINKRLLLVDYYNLLIRNFMMVPVTNDDGEHFGGAFGFLRCLKVAIEQFKPTDVYVICDGPNSALRRKMVDSNYKSSRKKPWKRGVVKAYDFLNENEQSDNFSMQIKRLNEYLETLPVKTLSIPYVEADDLIAEIVNTMPSDTVAVIYSTDADYKQLVNEKIVCYNPMAKQLTTMQSFLEKHGFLVANYIYFKVIVGDKSDDLPGVEGIGEKTFLKLYPHAATEVIGSLDDIFDHARHAIASKSTSYTASMLKRYQDILNAEELVRRNYQLMQLNNVDISLQSKDVCRELQLDAPNEFNRMKLRTMFIRDKLNGHVQYFEDWTRVFINLVYNARSGKLP